MIGKKINQLATELAPATTDLTIIGDPVTGVSKKITLLQIADLFATSGTVTSVAVTETGNALTITGSPITSAGTINIGFAGAATQYVRGDGQLSDFPTSSGGGSSVSYYLNSSVSQGTIGGVAYRQFNKTPIAGAGTDITVSTNGYIASYITDANDPALLEVPAGNFNCELYFSVNSNNHNPYVYAEVYKYDGTTFTLLGSSQSVPEYLTSGTTLSPYYFAVPVTATVLTITDRIAIRIYANVDGRTVTLHTENSHLCQVVTTFSKGLTSLNNLTRQVQFLATGTTGTDFNIASSTATHTFNIPTASATNRGALSSADWTTFNNKQNALTLTTTGSSGAATLVGATLNIPNYGSALTGYVPYTGATANLDLGTFELSSRSLFIEGTASYQSGLLIKQRGLYNFVTGAYTQIVADSATDLNIVHNQANTTRRRYALSVAALQDGDSFQYAVPRASGTIALTSQLTGGTVTSVAALTIGTSGTDLSSTVANGTTTPVITLNVPTASATNRGALSSTDWTTFNNKQNALTNPVTGTGTTNYLPKFTGTSAIGNSAIYDNSGNIGIGTTSAFYPLVVNGIVAINGSNELLLFDVGNAGSSNLRCISGSLHISTNATSNAMYISSGGLVGIGTTSPAARLTVVGATTVIGQTNVSARFSDDNNSTLLISHPSGDNTATITGNINLAFATGVSGSITEKMKITSAGNVGIGTTSPSDTLHLERNGAGIYNSTRYTNTSSTANFYVGVGGSGVANGSLQNNAYIYNAGASALIFGTNDTERMRITSGGNVGIGTTSPADKLTIVGTGSYTGISIDTGSTTGGAYIAMKQNGVSSGFFGGSGAALGDTSTDLAIYAEGGKSIRFYANGSSTERMRITTTTPGTMTCVLINKTSADGSYPLQVAGIAGAYAASATGVGDANYYSTSNTIGYHFYADRGAGGVFWVATNGDVRNANNSYGAISDISLKENIIDTNSKLADLLKVKVRNYNLIGDDKKQIGVIAQELETIFPSMIDTDNKTGLKSVKYSVFVPMLIKAMQEQQQQIEQLKNK
jgi:hypothetical protein